MGQVPKKRALGSPFSWSGALWTLAMAAGTAGLVALQNSHFLSEEMLILLVFVAVPVAAFCLSGKGQDRSDDQPAPRDKQCQ
jgi:hypothetical protein